MSTAIQTRPDTELNPQTEETLREIELDTLTSFTLADAIRAGSEDLDAAKGWGDGETTGCALTAAAVGAEKHGYI